MKKLVLILFVLLGFNSYGFDYPSVYTTFTSPLPTKMYCDDTAHVSMYISFINLKGTEVWYVPPGTKLSNVSGNCPSIPYAEGYYGNGTCTLSVTIKTGPCPSMPITGQLTYRVKGKEGRRPHLHDWDYSYPLPSFNIAVVPHPITMNGIPSQEATANKNFTYNLKSAVKYYDENKVMGIPSKITVEPLEQDGLKFDPTTLSITGQPNHYGTYIFKVKAENKNVTTQPVNLSIIAKSNPAEKPRFKLDTETPHAISGQKYSLNLLPLLEPQKGYMVTNQVSFHIKEKHENAEWLEPSKDNPTLLEGTVPIKLAGVNAELILVASSNTGGNSEEFLLKIPIAFDATKRPTINQFSLNKSAGSSLDDDLIDFISDPAQDATLKLNLVKVEPEAPWLHISPYYPTRLQGTIPPDAIGERYEITLQASTQTGGSSESEIVSLMVKTNDEYKPSFKSDQMILPMLHPGQPYFYDFVEHADVYPEFSDMPYTIQFHEDYIKPDWIRLENNTLKADLIPETLTSPVTLHIVIKNKPGGQSELVELYLYPINQTTTN